MYDYEWKTRETLEGLNLVKIDKNNLGKSKIFLENRDDPDKYLKLASLEKSKN
jgi:hypothetical protein